MVAAAAALPDLELRALSDEDLEQRYRSALAELGIDSEEEAHQVLDLGTAMLVEQLSRIEVFHPIAAAILWQADDQPWDQRRLVASLVKPFTVVLGGNRGGKTYAILEALVAFALGGDHPAVVAWLHDNDLPADLVPHGPGECYAVANTAAASIRIHRRDLEKLLPPDAVWYGARAKDEASVEIKVPGYATPAVIWFKSVDQPIGSYKGDQVRFIAISEEPKGEQGKLVLQECLRATAAVGGRVVIEMTPQDGMTWVYDDLVVAREYDPQVVLIPDGALNVMVEDHASLMRWYDSMGEDERRMRRYGLFVDRKGIIYSDWSRGDGDRWGPGHLCDPFEIPKEWPRFRSTDFGQTKTNGTAALWAAVAVGGDDDGTVYLYRERYIEGEPSFDEQARMVREDQPEDEDDWLEGAWGDPASAEGRAAFARAGLPMAKADNDVHGGISRCAERLRPVGGRPRLKVFRTLKRFTWEIERYRRDPNRRDGAPEKKHDHMMDAWRYLEAGICQWYAL